MDLTERVYIVGVDIACMSIGICNRCKRMIEIRCKGNCKSCNNTIYRQKKRDKSPLVYCQCGCEQLMHSMTMNRKPARFILGHTIQYIQGKGKEASHWKGGKRKHTEGYNQIWFPSHPNSNTQGYVLEHVKVMSDKIGRALNKGEVVHHKNGVRNDNRIENLELFATHAEHMKHHSTIGRMNKK